jgi:hypothetical protein
MRIIAARLATIGNDAPLEVDDRFGSKLAASVRLESCRSGCRLRVVVVLTGAALPPTPTFNCVS